MGPEPRSHARTQSPLTFRKATYADTMLRVLYLLYVDCHFHVAFHWMDGCVPALRFTLTGRVTPLPAFAPYPQLSTQRKVKCGEMTCRSPTTVRVCGTRSNHSLSLEPAQREIVMLNPVNSSARLKQCVWSSGDPGAVSSCIIHVYTCCMLILAHAVCRAVCCFEYRVHNIK